MSYKLIALDLDGTLCNDEKAVTPRTAAALKQAQKHGIRVALASARPLHGLFREMHAIDCDKHHGILIAYNGGKIVDASTKEILSQTIIPHDLAVEVLHYLKDFPVSPIIDDGEQFYAESEDTYKLDHECSNNTMDCTIVPSLADALDFDLVKILTSVQPEQLYDVLSVIGKPYEDRLEFVRTAPFYIEVMPKNIHKAASLQLVCEKLGIRPEEVIAFGDAENDLEMIQFAGHGVAMGNACDALKDAADEVTLSNNDDGIALSLEHLLDFLS